MKLPRHDKDYLMSILAYDKNTGVLLWRIKPSMAVAAGSVAGGLHPHGYRYVHVKHVNYAAHRLAWLFTYGEWPDYIDHINGVRHDNRICNLRSVTSTENLQAHRKARTDSTSGLLGACYRNDNGKWQARIQCNGKQKSLGQFDSPEEAHAAYLAEKGKK